MTDLSTTIAPKSDQLNADDLIGGKTITIKVTKVAKVAGEQPIAISYEGDNGKPYKPGKMMRRALVHFWGKEGDLYIGRFMTLYCDPNVHFGKDKTGGIRISHLSHIAAEETIPLTVSRGKRAPFTIKPLALPSQATQNAPAFKTSDERKQWITEQAQVLESFKTSAELQGWKYNSAHKLAALGDKQKEWMDGHIAAATKRLAPIDDEVPDGNSVIDNLNAQLEAKKPASCGDCVGTGYRVVGEGQHEPCETCEGSGKA